ncbi:16S rRNA (cytosine(967)-C(5))-methyltransferase RsmB [Parahaliea aestuarii]|uniref:16S rRNA (cytosine(967)-C(5))-methyltransferase n=1 Tax=Parahaliea aestuarii TaxID=1852021 RepID=A0A5C8ZXX0_9GAMM|nr:16S rRNA (cytosine(967)-C(5))-methyltransferase RsmB [Parahaliea aestuarii]TXS92327.1 16S rRNA (cytosine(967)-C(5))-methyltransferase RsmB [Parahaliea aestuarii]
MAGDCRAAAARVLALVASGQSLNQALPGQLNAVAPRDAALLRELCYGSLRMWPRLEALADQLLDKPLRGKDSDVYALILVGLYQLGETRVPDHAAVASTVGATRSLGKGWARGLVNALLRRYLRERETLENALPPAARAAHPAWLMQRLQGEYDNLDTLLAANNSRPPMALRVNLSRVARSDYLQQLEGAGIAASAGALADSALYLQQAVDVNSLPGWEAGLVSVQDEAAQLAAPLLQARAGERILDACAAPGGKSCHLLESQPGLAELVAMDIDGERLERVEENLERLQLAARVIVGDGAKPPAELAAESFDAILTDAPCSASGVIRRHPDIKLLRRASDIGQLAGQQLAILHGLWPLLKPGGRLLYVTCSILAEENSAVIARFLAQQEGASEQPLAVNWGQPRDHGRQLLPQENGPDGLYFALLTKAL